RAAVAARRGERAARPRQCRDEREQLEADLGERPEQPRGRFVLEPQQLVVARHRCLLVPVIFAPAGGRVNQTSIRSASPWPPPEQIAARPSPPPLRRRSCTIVPRIRPPLAPIGCPSATAPPLTFAVSGSAPSMCTELTPTDANASFTSTPPT